MMLLKIFISLAIVILPALISINFIEGRGARGGVNDLDQLSWTNIPPAHTSRYWIHLFLAMLVVTWMCRIARVELLYYTRLRHKWLISSDHPDRISKITILVTDISKPLLNVHGFHVLYNIYSHGVRRVIFNRDYFKLRQCVQKRNELTVLLENAETKLIKKTYLSRSRPVATILNSEKLATSNPVADAFWTEYLSVKDREKIRLSTQWGAWMLFIPETGKLVDKIDHYRLELKLLNAEIAQQQARSKNQIPSGFALIKFNHFIKVYMACQTLQHLRSHTMIASQVEEFFENVI